jgi:hypothetical protein
MASTESTLTFVDLSAEELASIEGWNPRVIIAFLEYLEAIVKVANTVDDNEEKSSQDNSESVSAIGQINGALLGIRKALEDLSQIDPVDNSGEIFNIKKILLDLQRRDYDQEIGALRSELQAQRKKINDLEQMVL